MSSQRNIQHQLNVRLIAITAVSLVLVAGVGFAWHARQVTHLAAALLVRADQLEQEQHYAQAAAYLSRYILLNPEDPAARARLATTFDRADADWSQVDRATRYYYQALGVAPENVDLRQRLTELLMAQQRWPAAQSEAEQLLAAQPDDPRALRTKALAQYYKARADSQADWSALAVALNKAITANPADEKLATCLADVNRQHLDPVQPAEADRIMDQVVEDSKQSAAALLARAEYRTKFKLAGADEDLDAALVAAPQDFAVLLAAAERDCRQQEWDAAIARYQSLIKLAPHDRRGYLALGQVYRQQGKSALASATLQSGLAQVGSEDPILGWWLADLWIEEHDLARADQQLQSLAATVGKLRAGVPARIAEAITNANDFLRAKWWLAQDKPLPAIQILHRLASVPDSTGEDAPIQLSQIEVQWRLAGAWARVGRWDQSATTYENVIAKRPADPVPRLAAAQAWLTAGHLDAALRHFGMVVTQPPVAANAWLPYAQALYAQQIGRPVAERNWAPFTQALAQVPAEGDDGWRAVLLEGEYDAATGHPDEALALLARSEQRFADQEPWLAALTLAYQRLEKPAEADRVLKDLEQVSKSSLTSQLTRVELLVRRGEGSQATALLESLVATTLPEPDRTMVQQRLAQQSLHEGKLDAARQILTELADRHPDNIQFPQELAELALETHDVPSAQRWEKKLYKLEGDEGSWWRYVRARRLLESALKAPNSGLAEVESLTSELESRRPSWSQGHRLRGMLAEQQGYSKQALEAYRQALALGDRRLQIYERLVALLYSMQKIDQAGQVLAELQQRTDDSEALSGLAIAVAIKTSEVERAVDLANVLVKRRPNDPVVQIWLGQTEQLANHPAVAEQAFKRATELAPHDPRAWGARFQFYIQNKQLDQARETLEKMGAQVQQSDTQRAVLLAQGYELLGDLPAALSQYQHAAQLAPDNADIQQRLAALLLRSHDPAIQTQLELMERTVKTPEERRNLALLWGARGDAESWDKSWQLLTPQDSADPDEAAVDNRLRAVLLMSRGRAEDRPQAIALLSKVVGNPRVSQPADRVLLAQLQEAEGNLKEARDQLESIPNPEPAQLAIYADFLVRHSPADAEPSIQKYEQAAPDSWIGTSLRARWLASQQRTPEIEPLVERAAERGLGKCKDDREKAQFALSVGKLYADVKLAAQAVRYDRQAYQISTEFYGPLILALVDQKQIGQAVQICREVVATTPSSKPARVLATAMAASDSMSAEIAAAAEPFLTQALEQYADDNQLLSAISGVRYIQGNLEAVIQLSKRILAHDPNNLLALNNLSSLLAEQPGHEAEALEVIDRAIAQDPQNPKLLDTKAMTLFHQGQWQAAAELLEPVVAKRGRDPLIRFHYALIHQQLQDPQRAREDLAAARAAGLTATSLSAVEQKLLTELEQFVGAQDADQTARLSAAPGTMMKTTLLLPWCLAAGITLAAAALHGHWTNRWGPSDAIPKASAVFAQLPQEFGAWHLVESQPLDPAARGILQCHDDAQGRYENRQTGDEVLFTLLLGPPGPMAVHTPEICYGAIDHVPLAQRQRIVLDPPDLENSAWMVQFQDLHGTQGNITRVYYTWTDGSKWEAVEEPRITFGGSPYLFKLQLLVRLPEESAAVAADPGRDFLREFLPVFAHAAAPLRRPEP